MLLNPAASTDMSGVLVTASFATSTSNTDKSLVPTYEGSIFGSIAKLWISTLLNFFMPEDRWAIYYFSAQEPQKQFWFHIRYSLIVVPMTLLSGILLLIKSWKRKQIQSPNGTALCQPKPSAWEYGPSP